MYRPPVRSDKYSLSMHIQDTAATLIRPLKSLAPSRCGHRNWCNATVHQGLHQASALMGHRSNSLQERRGWSRHSGGRRGRSSGSSTRRGRHSQCCADLLRRLRQQPCCTIHALQCHPQPKVTHVRGQRSPKSLPDTGGIQVRFLSGRHNLLRPGLCKGRSDVEDRVDSVSRVASLWLWAPTILLPSVELRPLRLRGSGRCVPDHLAGELVVSECVVMVVRESDHPAARTLRPRHQLARGMRRGGQCRKVHLLTKKANAGGRVLVLPRHRKTRGEIVQHLHRHC
mmetsp:Transcript_56758/g.124444  ORF Transcript_56758/g.124444 Transcript_56758/m.124444 type:complete len:284 (+) Transcript_56758:566-1417(+)